MTDVEMYKEVQEVKKLSDKWIQPEEMVDSKQVQMKSLIEFARGLGYYLDLGKHFYSAEFDNKKRRNISFATMCQLHNNHFQDNHGGNYFKAPFNFSTYKIRKARAGKIVHKVSLQMSKKTGYIRVSGNIVAFTHQEYEGFLDLKYL